MHSGNKVFADTPFLHSFLLRAQARGAVPRACGPPGWGSDRPHAAEIGVRRRRKQPCDAQVPSARAERHGAVRFESRCVNGLLVPAHRALSRTH